MSFERELIKQRLLPDAAFPHHPIHSDTPHRIESAKPTAGNSALLQRNRAGVYLTGPQSGATHNTAQQLGTWGRATYQVLQEPDYSLHLGANAGALLKPPAPGGIRSITLSDRPEVRVDPTVILSTGLLGTAAHPLNGALLAMSSVICCRSRGAPLTIHASG